MPQNNCAYNVGLRLVCNADDSVSGTVTTREAVSTDSKKSAGSRKALIIFYSWGGNTRGVTREIARPVLKTKIDSKKWAEYDTIILGYPICSHGGERFGQSLTAISKLAPKAKLTAGLSIHYSGGASLSKDVEKMA